MSRLTRDGTAEPVSRDQILRRIRGLRNNISFSLFQQTTSRIDNLTRLIHTLLCVYYHRTSIIHILPLSHKSGALCLYEPLPVSDALGDDFSKSLTFF